MEPAPIIIPSAPSPAPSVQYAGVGTRFIAVIIDVVAVSLPGAVVGIALGIVESLAKIPPEITGVIGIVLNLLVLLFVSIYYVYFIGSRGQTLGKMAMKIKVVSVDTNDPPGYFKAFLREMVGKSLSAMVLMLGYLWPLWDKKKQAWHDKIAGTVVIKV